MHFTFLFRFKANLALSSSVLLSPPKSPESKQAPTVSNPSSPCSSVRSTLQPVQLSCEDEVPVSFEQPAEGTPLLSINKVYYFHLNIYNYTYCNTTHSEFSRFVNGWYLSDKYLKLTILCPVISIITYIWCVKRDLMISAWRCT